MKNFVNYFKGKKVTLMGLGLLGRGVGDAEFLAECGADLIVTDLKSSTALRPSLQKLRKFKNIKYVLGKHELKDFRNADFILKAAGVPLDSSFIAEARKNNISIEMSASLFAKLSGIPVIGVTGTRGKSTVTYMVAHILKQAGKKILFGGNVRGVSTLSLLNKTKEIDYAVLELDSWQLQGFGESKISPFISVFTTFYGDHLNYYGSTSLTTSQAMEHYFSDKAKIFQNHKETDYLIVGKQAETFVRKWGGEIRSKIIVPETKVPEGFILNLPGEHNEYNAMLAVAVARVLGIKDEASKKAIKTFEPIEGRLEFLKTIKGVKIYNDNNSTTPEATIAGLRALRELGITNYELRNKAKNIILIMGGSDKWLDMRKLVEEIPKYCKAVILLEGSGTTKIRFMIHDSRFKNVKITEKEMLKECVEESMKIAEKGDIVLFSPAFASFGKYFKNEYDRGEQFVRIVKKFKKCKVT